MKKETNKVKLDAQKEKSQESGQTELLVDGSSDQGSADLEAFKKSFSYWVDRLNLNDWDYRCILDAEADGNASITIDPECRKCLARLNPEYERMFTNPAECAKHEALELLLGDMGAHMKVFFSQSTVNGEIHKVINRLMVALKED